MNTGNYVKVPRHRAVRRLGLRLRFLALAATG